MEFDEWKTLLSARTPGVMDAERQYAVLVPLLDGPEGVSLLYEVRAKQMRRQPGEVCFPGGRMEPGETPVETALRETWEELGVPRERISVLGPLDFIAHRANFVMYPVLARLDPVEEGKFTLNPAEVDTVFPVPLSWLEEHPPVNYRARLIPEMPEEFPYETVGVSRPYRRQPGWEDIPVYPPWEGHCIWGLTARITRHLVGSWNHLQHNDAPAG